MAVAVSIRAVAASVAHAAKREDAGVAVGADVAAAGVDAAAAVVEQKAAAVVARAA